MGKYNPLQVSLILIHEDDSAHFSQITILNFSSSVKQNQV